MNILVTGAHGFIGKNLVAHLTNIHEGKITIDGLTSNLQILEYDLDTDPDKLDYFCQTADFVFHLAGVNRPKDQSEFMEGNFGFTSQLLSALKKNNNTCPIMISSSIQAELDNAYGISKKAGEDLLLQYGKETGAKVLIYRFPNVFGKWCRPNYNSAIATFCHNIARDLPINVNDSSVSLNLVYIDDILNEMIRALKNNETRSKPFCIVPITHTVQLGTIVDLLQEFKRLRVSLALPDMSDPFVVKLYATFLSYIPPEHLNYPLKMNIDQRGSFTEIFRTEERGQFSINISKPGIVKGNHWHHTKNEKFLVVSGRGVIRIRQIHSDQIYSFFVSGEKLEIIDIPPGSTHNIENLGDSDMVTFMWANECFNPEVPDTYFLTV